MAPALPSAAREPVRANNSAGVAASRFYARNGDVFMTSAWGGYFLSRADEQRMLTLWRAETGDAITDTIRAEMADELEAAMADADAQINEMEYAA